MNALRSWRQLTSEISIFDTRKDSYAEFCETSAIFRSDSANFVLAKQEINEQQIERNQLKPEVINWLADEQKRKQDQHPDIRHQQSPPLEHRAGQISITRS